MKTKLKYHFFQRNYPWITDLPAWSLTGPLAGLGQINLGIGLCYGLGPANTVSLWSHPLCHVHTSHGQGSVLSVPPVGAGTGSPDYHNHTDTDLHASRESFSIHLSCQWISVNHSPLLFVSRPSSIPSFPHSVGL